MKKTIRKGFMLGIGAISLTTKSADKILNDILKKSKISKTQSEKLVKDMLSQTNKKARKIQGYVEKEVNKKLRKAKKQIKKITK